MRRERREIMQSMSRRAALTMMGGAAIAGTSPALASPARESLGEIAEKNGFVFGAAAGPSATSEARYRQLYVTQARIVTTDVALKMGTLAPQEGTLRYDSA